ncbi:putative protein arginine N-methyltransferase 6 [Sarracenia purpurea var. burkii]
MMLCHIARKTLWGIGAGNGFKIVDLSFKVKHVDCYTITSLELESVTTRFMFKSMMRAPFHGFAFWFDVEFSSPVIYPTDNNPPFPAIESSSNHPTDGSQRKKRVSPSEALVLSTAPEDPPTHWQQTLIYFYDPIEVEQDQLIEGAVTLTQSKENPRFMNIHLEYASGGRSFVKDYPSLLMSGRRHRKSKLPPPLGKRLECSTNYICIESSFLGLLANVHTCTAIARCFAL